MLKNILWMMFHVSVIAGITYLVWKHNELMNYIKAEWRKKELKKMKGNEEDKREYDEYIKEVSNEFTKRYNEEKKKEV